MKVIPKNKHLLVEKITEKKVNETSILMPDEKEEEYGRYRVLKANTANVITDNNSIVVVPNHMVLKIFNYLLVPEHAVLCVEVDDE